MIFGLASALVSRDNADEAIGLMERGLLVSIDEKQKATMRATSLYDSCV